MRNDVLKRIVIAIIIVVSVLALVFIGQQIAIKFFGYKTPSISESTLVDAEKIEIELDPETTYIHAENDKYIYFAATDSVLVVDSKGKQQAELSVSVVEPFIKTSGDYVLLGDFGGNNLYIIKGEEIVKSISTKKPIKTASINSSGKCVAVTEGDMHKRDVTVYDKDGKELFVWISGSKLVVDAAIADNDKNVVIASLETHGTVMRSVVGFYNISKKDPVATQVFDNEIISALKLHDNYVYCIGESKTATFTVGGDKKGEIPYKTKTLLSCETNKNGIVMSFMETTLSDKRYNIEIYSESAEKKAEYFHDYKAEYIDVSPSYIVIGREGLISVINYDGNETQLLDPGINIKEISFVGNEKKMVAFSSDGAYLVSVK